MYFLVLPFKFTRLKMVKTNQVVLFMKGEPAMPQCGFSKFVVEILRFYSKLILLQCHQAKGESLEGAEVEGYKSVNILEDEKLRSAVKKYSDWPTYPQLYVNGELVGGADILHEMHKEGTLKDLLASIDSK